MIKMILKAFEMICLMLQYPGKLINSCKN